MSVEMAKNLIALHEELTKRYVDLDAAIRSLPPRLTGYCNVHIQNGTENTYVTVTPEVVRPHFDAAREKVGARLREIESQLARLADNGGSAHE